jgi:DNA repair exonuclease SbcCD nuclease subunit
VQEEIFNYADANGVDIMVHDGDLFENRTDKINTVMYMTVFDRFVEFAKKSSALIVLLAGNHDFITKVEDMHVLTPFKKIDNIIVADKPIQQNVRGHSLAFIPYTRIGFKHAVDEMIQQANLKMSYLFTHQGVSGALTGSRDTPLRDEYSPEDFGIDAFDIVFNGHYHKPQAIGTFTSNNKQHILQIVGSPLQKDFGERNDEKGFFLLDTEKAPRQPVYIKTSAPRFFKIEVWKEEDIRTPAGFKDRDFLWIVSHGPDQGFIEDTLQAVSLANVRIEVDKADVKGVRTKISLSMSPQEQMELAIDYLLKKTGKELDKKRVLEMALDKYKKSSEV